MLYNKINIIQIRPKTRTGEDKFNDFTIFMLSHIFQQMNIFPDKSWEKK